VLNYSLKHEKKLNKIIRPWKNICRYCFVWDKKSN